MTDLLTVADKMAAKRLRYGTVHFPGCEKYHALCLIAKLAEALRKAEGIAR